MATNNACNFGEGTSGQVLTSNGAGSAPTFQAAPSTGVSYPEWANSATGFYFTPFLYTSSSSSSMSTNRTYLIPYMNNVAWTVSSMGVVCASYTSNDTMRVGVYTGASSTGAATLLADFGQFTVSGTGFQSQTGLSQSIPVGLVYFALNLSTNDNNQYAQGTGILGPVLRANSSNCTNMFVYNNSASTFPASITQAQVGANPSTTAYVVILQGT